MHVSGVLLPLVTACVGVSTYPAQQRHRGETGCAGPQDVVHPAAALRCLRRALSPGTLPAPRCCVPLERAAMDLRDVVWDDGSHPCSRLFSPARSQG